MGHGSCGSRVSCLMGHLGHGSQNVTHCQLSASTVTGDIDKCLANAKRPCGCSVLCLYVRKVHCAVVRTLFQTRRHSAVVTKVATVCAQCSECQREEIQKARVNGGSNYDSLTDSQKRKIAFRATLSGLRGYGRTPSIARWKPAVDFLFVIIDFFAISVETS